MVDNNDESNKTPVLNRMFGKAGEVSIVPRFLTTINGQVMSYCFVGHPSYGWSTSELLSTPHVYALRKVWINKPVITYLNSNGVSWCTIQIELVEIDVNLEVEVPVPLLETQILVWIEPSEFKILKNVCRTSILK